MKAKWFTNESWGLKPASSAGWITSVIALLWLVFALIGPYSTTRSISDMLINGLLNAYIVSVVFLGIAYGTSDRQSWFAPRDNGRLPWPMTWQAWWIALLAVSGLVFDVVVSIVIRRAGDPQSIILILTTIFLFVIVVRRSGKK